MKCKCEPEEPQPTWDMYLKLAKQINNCCHKEDDEDTINVSFIGVVLVIFLLFMAFLLGTIWGAP